MIRASCSGRTARRSGAAARMGRFTSWKGEVTPGPAWMGGKELKLWKKHGATVVLWGEPDARAGGWYEARIPKALPYDFAAAAGRRVAIRTRNYRAPDGSEITRYVGVEVM